MTTEWRPVVGYEGLYEVSSEGQVRRLARDVSMPTRWGGQQVRHVPGGILKPICREKSCVVALSNGAAKAMRVHRVVMAAFVGPCPDGMETCHNNGDFTDNRLENLRYDTHSSNVRDSIRHGTFRGKVGPRAKISFDDAVRIRERRAAGESSRALACEYGLSIGNVFKIVRGAIWPTA